MEENKVKPACKVVVIGGSAGSLSVILNQLPKLRIDLPMPIVLVLHRKNTPDTLLEELLSGRTGLRVKEAEEKEYIQNGTIYIAPADYHLLIEEDFSFSLDYSEKLHYSRPSIDVTFESVAEAYGPAATGILLSGASTDGVEGLQFIQQKGGVTIVQNPEQAEVPFMPRHAIELFTPNYILNDDQIAGFINEL